MPISPQDARKAIMESQDGRDFFADIDAKLTREDSVEIALDTKYGNGLVAAAAEAYAKAGWLVTNKEGFLTICRRPQHE